MVQLFMKLISQEINCRKLIMNIYVYIWYIFVLYYIYKFYFSLHWFEISPASSVYGQNQRLLLQHGLKNNTNEKAKKDILEKNC